MEATREPPLRMGRFTTRSTFLSTIMSTIDNWFTFPDTLMSSKGQYTGSTCREERGEGDGKKEEEKEGKEKEEEKEERREREERKGRGR